MAGAQATVRFGIGRGWPSGRGSRRPRGASTPELGLLQQTEILLPRNTCRLQVIPDNGDGNLIIGRNHNRSGDARFRVRTVAAFLPGESKSSGKEHLLQNLPVDRRDSRHLQPPMTAVCLSVATQEGLTQLPWRSS